MTRIWLEVRAGRRPLAQLAPVVAPALLRRLAAQIERPPAVTAVPKVGRVVASRPHPEACEATVTITATSGRTTALAVRLERHLGVWRVVELTAPESGLRALPTASLPEGWHRRDAFDEVEDERRR